MYHKKLTYQTDENSFSNTNPWFFLRQKRRNFDIRSRFVNTLPQAPIHPLRSKPSPETGSPEGNLFRKQSLCPGCCHYQTTDQQSGERFVPQTGQQIKPPLPGQINLPLQGWETGGTPMI
jgi:hypothetical protein